MWQNWLWAWMGRQGRLRMSAGELDWIPGAEGQGEVWSEEGPANKVQGPLRLTGVLPVRLGLALAQE